MSKEIIAEKISIAINPNAEAPQLSERTINEVLDTLLPLKGEEESEDAFVERFLPTFQTMAGNVRNDVSDFSKSLKDEFEKKKDKKKDGAGDGEGNEGKKGDDEPEWVKALMGQMNEFKDWKDNQEAKKTVEETKKNLVANAKKIYPENVVSVASLNFDFGKENADELFKESLSESAKFMGVKPETGKSDTEPDYKDLVERQKRNLGID